MGPGVPWAMGHLGIPNIHVMWSGRAQESLPGPLPRGGVALTPSTELPSSVAGAHIPRCLSPLPLPSFLWGSCWWVGNSSRWPQVPPTEVWERQAALGSS